MISLLEKSSRVRPAHKLPGGGPETFYLKSFSASSIESWLVKE